MIPGESPFVGGGQLGDVVPFIFNAHTLRYTDTFPLSMFARLPYICTNCRVDDTYSAAPLVCVASHCNAPRSWNV